MKTHRFGIIAAVPDFEGQDFEDRFFRAGCDDATIGVRNGTIHLAFARVASSFDEAIASAVDDVKSAGGTIICMDRDRDA